MLTNISLLRHYLSKGIHISCIKHSVNLERIVNVWNSLPSNVDFSSLSLYVIKNITVKHRQNTNHGDVIAL